MHLELTDSKGERHRRQCLEFWIDKPQAPAPERYYVTIDRPWETGTDVGCRSASTSPSSSSPTM
jgi:hypothetical protein